MYPVLSARFLLKIALYREVGGMEVLTRLEPGKNDPAAFTNIAEKFKEVLIEQKIQFSTKFFVGVSRACEFGIRMPSGTAPSKTS